MKKLLLSLLSVVMLCGCSSGISKQSSTPVSRKSIKEQYEEVNGKKTDEGKTIRTIEIPEDNPFVEVSAEDIVEKIKNKETFYVYFGDPLCPWCRSVIEEAIKVAKKNNIKSIYYVDIWDDKGEEKLRDKFVLEKGQPTRKTDGTKAYNELLKDFGNLLSDYTLTDDKGNTYQTGEKRIYAPNYIYVKNGKAVRLTEGVSEKETDAYMKLSKDMLKDEDKYFNDFFKNK